MTCHRPKTIGLVSSLIALLALGCAHPQAKMARPAVRALAAPHVTPGDFDAEALVRDVAARATKLGAGPLSIISGGEVVEGERIGAFVDVPADVCLLSYGRGSASVEDLDIAAFTDEGSPVAIDEGPDPKPALLLCPPHPERVYVAAHAASGAGLVALAAQFVPRDRALDVGRALNAKGAEGPRATDAWPGLDDRVRAHRVAIGGHWEELRRVAVTLDAHATTFVGFPIGADQCVDAQLIPGDQIAAIEAEVEDSDGRVIARAHESGNERTMTVCSPVEISASLSLRPHVGRGIAAVILAKARSDVARDLASSSEIAWAAPGLPLEKARAAKNATLAKGGYGPATATANGALVLGRRASVPLDLTAGGCFRVDVVAGEPLALVHATIWDDTGTNIAASDGSDGATLFACTKAHARLDLETGGRPGPYTVMTRKELWQDPLFVAHPIAASRMLARLAAGPERVHEGSLLATRFAAVEGGKELSWNATIPAGSCVRTAAGASGEGTGIELRLTDAADDDELDRAHASHAAEVRACALPNAARAVRFELVATSGKLEVIVGERLEN